MEITEQNTLLQHATSIIAAYVSNNTIQKEHIPTLIADTFGSLARLNITEAEPEPLTPAVPVKRSVQPDHIVCLEDGKKFKSLKRHLMSHYNMTPEEYREKWGLPRDYPMVAPSYAAARSKLAKESGLGRREVPAIAGVTPQPAVKGAKVPAKSPSGKKTARA
jgi:predicted transcriptional regulator